MNKYGNIKCAGCGSEDMKMNAGYDGLDELSTEGNAPQAFRSKTKLSQHISFLRDFFRCYKDFTDREIDTIELLLIKLYDNFNISDDTDWNAMRSADYPILSDFYALIEAEYRGYNSKQKNLFTAETLQNICLGLHSLCKGAESKFFDGHTNITDSSFVTFGVKGLLQASKNIRNALLFNVLSYMSEQLLTKGNTVASIDEFLEDDKEEKTTAKKIVRVGKGIAVKPLNT